MKNLEVDKLYSPSEIVVEQSKFSLEKKQEKLREACQDFEAFLLSFIFRKAMQPLFVDQESPFMGREEVWFREMWLDEICKQSCRFANLQIGDLLYRSLKLSSPSEEC